MFATFSDHSALSVADAVVKHARDEVSVLKLDLSPPLQLAVAVLAPLEPRKTPVETALGGPKATLRSIGRCVSH